MSTSTKVWPPHVRRPARQKRVRRRMADENVFLSVAYAAQVVGLVDMITFMLNAVSGKLRHWTGAAAMTTFVVLGISLFVLVAVVIVDLIRQTGRPGRLYWWMFIAIVACYLVGLIALIITSN